MKKKSFLYGALILTISALISKVLGAIYRIPLTNLIGTEGVGLYQMIFPVYSLFLVISSSGIPVVISRLVSEEVTLGNIGNAKKIFKYALALMFVIGLFLSVIIFFLGPYIAKLQGNELATIGYLGIAPAIIVATLVAGFRGYFQGLENMKPTALSEVVEQVSRVGLGLLLASLLLPRGIEYGVLGAVLGVTLSESVSLITIYIIYLFNKKKEPKKINLNVTKKYVNAKEVYRHIFKKSVPITMGAIVLPITYVLDSVLIINLLVNSGFNTSIATSLFGIQTGVVNSLIYLPMVIAYSVATAVLPTITASNTLHNKKEVSLKSIVSLKIVFLIALPCFVGLIILAPEITNFLYFEGLNSGQMNEIDVASALIRIGAVSIIYMSLLRILTSILHALDRSFKSVRNLAISSLLKVTVTLILVSISYINIYGAMLASVVSYSLACMLNLLAVRKEVDLKIDIKQFLFYPLFAVLIMVLAITVSKLTFGLFLSQNLTTLFTIIVAGLSYVITIIILDIFSKEEEDYISVIRKIKQKYKSLKKKKV